MIKAPDHPALKSGHVYIDWLFQLNPKELTQEQVDQLDTFTCQTNDLWEEKIFNTKQNYSFEHEAGAKSDNQEESFNSVFEAGKKFIKDYRKLDKSTITAGLGAQFDIIQSRMQAGLDHLKNER